MERFATSPGILLLAGLVAGLYGCSTAPDSGGRPAAIVGAWLVRDPNAPFPYHMYVFNGDHTMQQANPDAGDAHASDSDGKGIWAVDGSQFNGKWVEVTADRATHAYAGRLEISYRITVSGDTFTGTETVRAYDGGGHSVAAPPTPAAIEGRRVTLP